MPSTIPNSPSLALLQNYLPAGQNIDVHLLTAPVADGTTTAAGLSIVSGGSYTTKSFALTTPIADGTGAIAVPGVSTITWMGLYTTAATPIVAVGFTRRASGAFSTTDLVLCGMELVQTIDVTIANVTTTNGSASISTTNSFSALAIGQPISGTGIPTGTTILQVVSATSIIMSRRATATGTISLTAKTASPYTPPTTVGTAIDFTITIPSILLKLDDYQ